MKKVPTQVAKKLAEEERPDGFLWCHYEFPFPGIIWGEKRHRAGWVGVARTAAAPHPGEVRFVPARAGRYVRPHVSRSDITRYCHPDEVVTAAGYVIETAAPDVAKALWDVTKIRRNMLREAQAIRDKLAALVGQEIDYEHHGYVQRGIILAVSGFVTGVRVEIQNVRTGKTYWINLYQVTACYEAKPLIDLNLLLVLTGRSKGHGPVDPYELKHIERRRDRRGR